MKGKRLYDKYKDYFIYSKSFLQTNPKEAYVIALYAANTIHSQYKSNASLLNNTEITNLGQEIKNLKSIDAQYQKTDQEEYTNFIENMFANVDQEDREGEVSPNTAKSFKMLSDLIEVFLFFGEIPEEWKEKRKYCKFKAVDIMQSFKRGEVPRRGGPNDKKVEKKDEIDEELKNMEKEVNYEKKIIEENEKIKGKIMSLNIYYILYII